MLFCCTTVCWLLTEDYTYFHICIIFNSFENIFAESPRIIISGTVSVPLWCGYRDTAAAIQ